MSSLITADKPKMICLIGSSRFKYKFHEIGEKLEKSGCLPLMMSFFQHADNRPVSVGERKIISVVDRFRIDLAEEVWVLNVEVASCAKCRKPNGAPHGIIGEQFFCNFCKETTDSVPVGYVGEDTLREINYAKNKVGVRWLNSPTSHDLPLPATMKKPTTRCFKMPKCVLLQGHDGQCAY